MELEMEQDEGHQEEESQGGCSAEKEERRQGVRRGGLDTAQHQKPDTFFFFPERGKYYVCKRWPECWLLWKPQLSIQWLRPSIAIYTMLLTTAQELHLRNRELWY